MKVGELFAELKLSTKSFEADLRKMQKLADSVTKSFSKPINAKGMFANIARDANAASKAAANSIKGNLNNATKGINFDGLKAALNFKVSAGPINSITTGLNGVSIAAGLAAAGIGAAVNAISEGLSNVVEIGSSFEQQMSAVAAVSFAGQDMGSAEVQAAFKALEDQAITLGSSTTFTAEQVGQAQELLAKAGFATNEIISATPGLLAAAAAEGLDLASTADIASSALRGFGLEADQMNMVADVLAKTAATSNASISGMGESFKYIAPVAQAVGLNIQDVSASLGLLANMGIKGSVAGRNLASGIMSLTAPSKEARTLMTQLGISVVDATGNFKQLPDIFANIEQATNGMTDAQKLATVETIVGKDNAKTYLGILNAQYKTIQDGEEVTLSGAEAVKIYSNALSGSAGAAEAMANIRLDNLAGDMERLSGAADAMAIQMYKKAQPALRAMAQGATQALETIAPVAIEVFGAIVDGAMMVRDAAMPGLIAAWNALKPAISSIVPIIANVIGGFAVFASQAVAWGSKIVAGLAQGMAAAIQRIVAVLKYIGSIIRYWLQPNSPPKIVPELDQYGQEAGQLYVDSMANADVSGAMQILGNNIANGLQSLWSSGDFQTFNDIAAPIEESIRSLGETGAMAKDAIVPAIQASRSAVTDFINSIKETGKVSEDSLGTLISSLGPVEPEVQNLVRAYADLYNASKDVADAQDELNRVTAEYAEKISPIQQQLDSINAEQERIRDMQRIEELQKKIAEGKLDEKELALAQLEIQEIGVKQQLDAAEAERDVAVTAAEDKLSAAEDAQKAAQMQYDTAQAQVEATKTNNALMQEQVKILEEIAKASADAASAGAGIGGGGMGGGMPDMGGMPNIEEMAIENPFQEFETSLTEISSGISQFQTDINNGKTAVDNFFASFTQNPLLNTFNSGLSNTNGIIQSVGGFITGTLLPPLSYLWTLLQSNVIPAVSVIGQKIQETFVTQGGPALTQFQAILTTLAGVFEQLKPAISGLIALVGGGLLFAFVGIAEIVGNALPGILLALSGTFQFINGVIQLVVGTIVGLGQVVGAVFAGDLPAAGNALLGVWETIKTASANIVSGLFDVFIGLGGSLAGIAAGIFEDIYAIVTGKVVNVRDEVTRIMGEMKDNALTAIQDFFNGAVQWFTDLYNELVGNSIVPDMVNEIIKWFQELPAKVVAFVEQLYKDVIKWFEDTKTKAVETFGNMSTEALKKIEEMKTNVVTAVTNIATEIGKLGQTFLTEAKNIGDDIIGGIVSGIEAAKGAVKTAVDAVASMIPEWAKEMLGVASPAKEMIPIGAFASEGLAVGITKGMPLVQTALINVSNLVITKLTGIREEARYLFSDIADVFKGVSAFLSSSAASVNAVGGLLPSTQGIKDAKKKYNELMRDLYEASDGIENIDKELLEKRKKIQDDLVNAIKDSNKKIIDLQKERAKIEEELEKKRGEDSEGKALQRQIARLESIADPNDVLMQERIAALRDQMAEKQKESEDEINDLLDRRAEIDEDLNTTQIELAERKIQLEEELRNAEANADKDRQEALKRQLDLLEQISSERATFGREQKLYQALTGIAEQTRKIFSNARNQLDGLQSLNPQTAAEFFNTFQGGINDIAKIEQELVKELLNPENPDNRKIEILRQQLALARQGMGSDFEALRQGQLADINEIRTDDIPDSPAQLEALRLQEEMIKQLNLLSLIPNQLNNTALEQGFISLPDIPQEIRTAITERENQSAVDVNDLFNRLINAIQPRTTNNNLSATYTMQQSGLSINDELRLRTLLGA